MAVFTTNQTRQLYVAKYLKDTKPIDTDSDGTMYVGSDTGKTHLYFTYKSPGGVVRSDLIDIKDIMSVKLTDADNMRHGRTKFKVALSPTINSGLPVSAQNYILKIYFKNYIGPSDAHQLVKYGVVHAVAGMTAEEFYTTLYNSLVENFKRESKNFMSFGLDTTKASVVMTTNTGITVNAINGGTAGNSLKFAIGSVAAAEAGVVTSTSSGITTITASLTTAAKTIADLKALILADSTASTLISIAGTDATTVLAETTAVALTGGATNGVIIEEGVQDWDLGTFEYVPANFVVCPTQITYNSDIMQWGVVTSLTPTNFVENGKMVADQEWFYMGERGDYYRNMGYPNVLKTKYLVDSSVRYNALDIHYYKDLEGTSSEKSEKSIYIVIPKIGSTNSVSNVLANSLASKVATATGLTITALSVA